MVENERKDANTGDSGGPPAASRRGEASKSPKKLPALPAGRRVFLRTFGWPLVQVPQDDFGYFKKVK